MDLEFEKGQNYPVEITHEIDGFLISYPKIGFDDFSLERTDIKSLLKRITEVMGALSMKASKLVLEIVPNSGRTAGCNVDKRRVIHLSLPVHLHNGHLVVPSRGIDEDYLLYHELMHAKDVLEGRFPSAGMIDIVTDFKEWLKGFACDFSIEGRLENSGKPHYSREQCVENVLQCVGENYQMGFIRDETMKSLSKGFLVELCNNVWGKELTLGEVDLIIQKLMG